MTWSLCLTNPRDCRVQGRSTRAQAGWLTQWRAGPFGGLTCEYSWKASSAAWTMSCSCRSALRLAPLSGVVTGKASALQCACVLDIGVLSCILAVRVSVGRCVQHALWHTQSCMCTHADAAGRQAWACQESKSFNVPEISSSGQYTVSGQPVATVRL